MLFEMIMPYGVKFSCTILRGKGAKKFLTYLIESLKGNIMSKNNFVLLCLRLLGIYFAVLGLSSLPNVISMFFGSSNGTVSYFFASPIIFLICGFGLCIFAPRISRHIIEFGEAEDDGICINASERATRIALLILGIFIFSKALSQLLEIAFNIAHYYHEIEEIPEYLRQTQSKWTYLIGPFINLVIGIVLIIGPDKIIGILAKYDVQLRRIESSSQTNSNDR